MLKFIKRIIIVIILVIAFAGTILTYKGYQVYKEALNKISVADKVAEIKQKEKKMTPLDQTAQLAARPAHLAHPAGPAASLGHSLPFPVPPTRVETGARPRRTPSSASRRGQGCHAPASSIPPPTRPRSPSWPLRLPPQIHLPLPSVPHRV